MIQILGKRHKFEGSLDFCEVETSLIAHYELLIAAGSELLHETSREKTNKLGFRPGPTQTSLYSHRSRPEA